MEKIDNSNSFISEKKPVDDLPKGYFQLDLLKAIMILLVIVDHTVPAGLIHPYGNTLWERISIPVFLIVMGMNMGFSFQKKNQSTLRDLYTKKYFIGKIIRYFAPFIIAWIISTIIGVFAFYNGSFSQMINERFSTTGSWGEFQYLLGILPYSGPGNWFISVVIQSIIFLPLLYYFYKKSPKWTLLLTFIFDAAIQLALYTWIGPNYLISSMEEYIIYWHKRVWIALSFIRYVFPVTLGFWFSEGFTLRKENSNKSFSNDKKFLLLSGAILILFVLIILAIQPNFFSVGYLLIGMFFIISLLLMWNFAEYKQDFLKRELPVHIGLVIFGGGLITLYTELIENGTPLILKLLLYFGILVAYALPIILTLFWKQDNRIGFIWSFFMISLIYITNYQFRGLRIEFLFGDYQLMVYGYSALWILLVMHFVPSNPNGRLFDGIRMVGRSTYHILFTQIIVLAIFTGIWGTSYFEGELATNWFNGVATGEINSFYVFLYLLICWIICIPIGVLWYWGEGKVIEAIKRKGDSKD
ncbi:acyltransferase family protein [Candidatus Lokiarchaeum ossiferum]|uniref:acyltransferase family protein n=1 Tax=Candidatus Lokiarchaeum ossiferum TaxID=2951803 RepID=UPI00352D97B1